MSSTLVQTVLLYSFFSQHFIFLIRKSYHLPCGLENGSQQQFFGNFVSYCRDHKPVQAPLLERNRGREEMWGKRDECGCCTMELEEEGGTTDFLWTPCCNGWFHRQVCFY